MINNRQNGRRRGRGNNNNGGGNPRQGGQGRGDSGNRIDSRARGNAAQLLEKYKNMAADAQRQGDRVNTEYYLQFADHYFRVLADQRGRFEEQQPRDARRPSSGFDLDGDEEYGDEGEPIRAGEQAGERDERPDRMPSQGREDRGQNGQRRWEPRGERAERPAREERGEPQIAGQHRSDPPVAGENLDERAERVLEADAPLPRRRGRPRREPVVAGEEGSVASGVDADRLPPSLGLPANDSDEAAPKPRRRRAPRAAGEGAPAAE